MSSTQLQDIFSIKKWNNQYNYINNGGTKYVIQKS